MKQTMHLFLVMLVSLLSCCSGSCGGVADPVTTVGADTPDNAFEQDDEWAVVLIDNERAGFMHSSRAVVNGKVHTQISSELLMKRGGVPVSLSSTSIAVETLVGVPLSFVLTTTGSGFDKTVKGTIKEGVAELIITTSGVSHRTDISWPSDCLLSEGVRLLGQSQGLAEGTQYGASVFDFESLSCQATVFTVEGADIAPVPEMPVSAHRVRSEVETSGGQVVIRNWVNDQYRLVMSSVQMMGMRFDTIAVDRVKALERHEGPEIFTRSFIESPRPVTADERRRKLSYVLSPVSLQARLSIPSSFEQKVVDSSNEIRVTVTPQFLPMGDALNAPISDPDIAVFLLPGAWIQSAEPEIVSLSRTAVDGATHRGEAARRIERFVARYMAQSGLETGYASALETLRTRKGDCTEYALLTAALCRAAGIPARIALGIVYAEKGPEGRAHFFGGHAWTQVYLEENWYSLDAALSGFGSGHVAVSYNNGDPENLTALINAIGNIRIVSVD